MPPSPASGAGALQLSLPNERSSLEVARQALLRLIDGQDLSERVVYRLELVLEETLMNLIWHAFPAPGEHLIELRIWLKPDAVALQFEDDGVAFDPTQAATRPAPRSLDEAVPGGLGLLLTRKSTSRYEYQRIGQRNRLTLEVARHAPG